MNINIIYCISRFVNFNEYRELSLLNKESRKLLYFNEDIPHNIKYEFAINQLLKEKYPIKLLQIFNPIKLYNVPFMKNKIYPGSTSYIDYLNLTYFVNNPIIRGLDKLNRLYISFYYNDKVTTLFQRYSDENIRWVTGGCNPFDSSVCVFDFDEKYYKESDTIRILSELLNNKISNFDNKIYKLNQV
jgi:hypothetical protein